MGTFLKMHVSEIRVKQIRVNQGLGVCTQAAQGPEGRVVTSYFVIIGIRYSHYC